MAVYPGKPEAETNNGTTSNDTFENILGADVLNGRNGSDTFIFQQAPATGTTIDGGTDNGVSDAVVTAGTSTTTGSTLSATVSYNATDVLSIENSMDLSALSFTHIEKILLKDGVNLTMSSKQFEAAQASLDYVSGTSTLNPGLQIQGTAGGAAENLTVVVAPDADFQLDDATTGYLFKDVNTTIQFTGGNVRYDGTAGDEVIRGGSGTEYITSRLGNDTVYAGSGNDLLLGGEGADKLYGEAGNDIFLLSRIATKAGGGTFSFAKASDGTAELVAGDLMDGGEGVDQLMITATGTAVSATENTITLTPSNFQNIEKVTIGTASARDTAKYAAVQDQMAAGDYTAVTTGKDAINVNGSALTAGVTYQGNDGNNIIKAGSGNDRIFAGGGNDALSGGAGNDILDGGAGVDTLVLDPAALAGLKVFLSRDHFTAVANTLTGEQDTFMNLEKADIGGQQVDIGFLAQPYNQLQNIGVLSKLLFNKAAGVQGLSDYASVSGNAQALADAALNSSAAKTAFANMSNAQFATALVTNGLGVADAATVHLAEDFLNAHSRAELVAVGIQYEPIVTQAYGAEGLILI